MFRRTCLALTAIAAFGGPAVSQTVGIAEYQFYELGFPVSLSPFSGLTTGTTEFLRANSLNRNGFLYQIRVDERRDAPCQMHVEFYGENNSPQTFSECGSRGPINEPSLHSVFAPNGVMVNSIRICLNAANDKIKGMRIDGNFAPCLLDSEATYAVVPKPDKVVHSKVGGGHVGVVPQDGHYLRKCSPAWFDQWIRNGCRNWRPTVRCPAGQVAYGVGIAYAQGNGDRRRIHGVRLACAPVALKQ